MSDETNKKEPAFPLAWEGKTEGLTKREWFAGMALTGIVDSELNGEADGKLVVKLAYLLADAMIEASKQ